MGKGKLNSMKYCFIFIRLRGKKVRVSKFGEAIGETEILFFFLMKVGVQLYSHLEDELDSI